MNVHGGFGFWRNAAHAAAAAGILLRSATTASAQCDLHWLPGEGVPGVTGRVPGIGGIVRALAVWDDGNREALYIGGEFLLAGETFVNHIARWDGNEFVPLGSGFAGDHAGVRALCVYEGHLVASGQFSSAGNQPAGRIARWDGSQWHPLGEGLGGSGESSDYGPVWALTVFEGDLIAGGSFTTAGGHPALSIARWDGSSWHPMGAGLNYLVTDLLVYNDELIAAGFFNASGAQAVNRIARWDGTAWQPLGSGMDWPVHCLTVFKGDLIAGGEFNSAGGQPASNIARWDGESWHAMTTGLTSDVIDLVVHEGDLIAMGWFSSQAGQPLRHIARWNGSSWDELGTGLQQNAYVGATYGRELIVGGEFKTAGSVPVASLARWNGKDWSAVGFDGGCNGSIYTLDIHDDELVATGSFTQIGGTPAGHVARFDGTSWHAMGVGVNADYYSTWVRCTGHVDGDLVIGGNFPNADGQLVRNVARWNGTQWNAMGEGLAGLSVSAFTNYRGELIAGGSFYGLGNVARWDGATWQTIGGGTDEYVSALVVYDGELIAGGAFGMAGDKPIKYLARWDGESWQPFPQQFSGTAGRVGPLVVFQGQLIISACVGWADGSSGCRTARWDAATKTWQALATPFTVVASDLKVIDNMLFATGRYSSASDGIYGLGILRWDGQAWHLVAEDMATGTVELFQGDFFAGGSFITAGNELSAYIARATTTPAPGDTNCDQIVDVNDLLIVIGNWGACSAPPAPCPGDIAPAGGDGVVNDDDLLAVITNWS